MTEPTAGARTAREGRLARRRARNQAEHFAAKAAAARTPVERLGALWDQWRALAAELPEADRDRLAERLADELAAQLAQIDRLLQGDRP
ncbi:hypothetical protein ACQP1W_52380 (plasmid) [Spirillospora sp. CA-255316]